jgi:hypothetical protein
MKWFYAKQGNMKERGFVEEDELHEMASDGKLERDDLVWKETSDAGWVRASSVWGLFPKEEGEEEEKWMGQQKRPARTMAEAVEEAEAEEEYNRTPVPTTKPKRSPVPIFLALIAVVIFFAWTAKQKHEAGNGADPEPTLPTEEIDVEPNPVSGPVIEPDVLPDVEPQPKIEPAHEPEPDPETEEEEDPWVPVRKEVDLNLRTGKVKLAELRIIEMAEVFGADDRYVKLFSARLAQLKKQLTELAALKKKLPSGDLTEAEAERLSRLSTLYDPHGHLHKTLVKMLTAEQGLTAPICIGAVRTASAMDDAQLVSISAREYSVRVSSLESEVLCLEVARHCQYANLNDQALAILIKYLDPYPKAASVWYERSALEAASGQKDRALKSLKIATRLGGDKARARARKDIRFNSIKETWTFGRYTK